MIVNGIFYVFLCGCLGGIGCEALHWTTLAKQNVLPVYVRRARYWIATLAMILVGGATAIVYFGGQAQGIVAVHLGAATPLLFQKFVGTLPTGGGGKGGGVLGLRPTGFLDFFRW